jgi:hypothetical protein
MTDNARIGRMLRESVFAALLVLAVSTPALMAGQGTPAPPALAQAAARLIPALKASPGCLGVEVGSTISGKQVIFAWFESKQALQHWYYSDTHTMLMSLAGASPSGAAMATVPEDVPIFVIASFTAGGSVPGAATNIPAVPQISIELYTPLPGGAGIGGRFSPSAINVPGFKALDPALVPDQPLH